jgi:hypothetical protein
VKSNKLNAELVVTPAHLLLPVRAQSQRRMTASNNVLPEV